jgi:hypothetical protein
MPILPKSEILNPKHETNSKHECSNVQDILTSRSILCFADLTLENWNLPFDLAQGGSPSILLRTLSLSNGLSSHLGFRNSDFGFPNQQQRASYE